MNRSNSRLMPISATSHVSLDTQTTQWLKSFGIGIYANKSNIVEKIRKKGETYPNVSMETNESI